jgi:hypothetical protein
MRSRLQRTVVAQWFAAQSSRSWLTRWMQKDLPVVQLAKRNPPTIGRADLHNRIDGTVEEFTAMHAGASQQFGDQPDQWVRILAGGALQLRGRCIVQELGKRLINERGSPANTSIAIWWPTTSATRGRATPQLHTARSGLRAHVGC